MADSDPISEATPSLKRQKLSNGQSSKLYDSADDSGDDLFNEHETIATLPLKRPLQSSQPLNGSSSYITQPTQQYTQYTQFSVNPQDVQVERSSPPPPITSPPRMPAPITKAAFAKPQGLLASASMAPRGTVLRKPVVQKEVVEIDSDMSDPPIEHSSDEEPSRSLASKIKPTTFVTGGRGTAQANARLSMSRAPVQRQASPRQVVQESPRADSNPSVFSTLVSQFRHNGGVDDLTSSYGGTSRPPRPIMAKPPAASSPSQQSVHSQHQRLDDISDFTIRQKVERMQNVLGRSVAECYNALRRKHMNYDDALAWLVDSGTDQPDSVDDLAYTPWKESQRAKGVAQSTSQVRQTTNVAKASAKQAVKAPIASIAQRYTGASNAVSRPQSTQFESRDGDDDVFRPKGRLLGDRRRRTPSPEIKPSGKRLVNRKVITIDDDDDSDEDVADEPEPTPEPVISSWDERVLDFFNTCSNQDLMDMTSQTSEDVDLVISSRPFRSLDQIRTITKPAEPGKKRSRSKAIGEKILDTCEEMLAGYDAVDHLVNECEKLAKPIQESLKTWGAMPLDGELHLMSMEEMHDSGVGTPSSSYSENKTKRPRKGYLSQPSNMSTEITMKDYQLVGLNWLHLLYQSRTSCILADDMGLGKTCQVIGFLAQLQLEAVDGVHLIIVPGSTLENWLRELQRFAPSLRVLPYYGPEKERLELQQKLDRDFHKYDVVVTTYDMAVNDNRFIRDIEPAVCVYDEAHQLRNPKSNRYDKLMRIQADFKVLLTGTPLQNNLQELIAILAFIMPDMFSEKREQLEYIFKHKASTKDADHSALLSAQRTQRARSMITPFILRRKKAQVLDLPAKHSRVEYCELSETQEEMYYDVQDVARRIFEERAAGNKKVAPKASANVLMDLRKAAIHPLLKRRIYTDKKVERIAKILVKHDEFGDNPLDKVQAYLTGTGYQSLSGNDFAIHHFCAERHYLEKYALRNEEWMDSGKVHKFKELVQQFAENGDKILVFSQFTMVMDILESVLQTLNIKFMRLDGSTQMDIRQSMIDDFNTKPEITMFMLSTKAGGAGINLASANKVIIFDSGFNPQDDIQAENRAHRVGQTREVEVIRLVSKGTIEEQIHALGASKLALDERVAGEGASAAEDKAAEKAGQEAVEAMLLESIHKKEAKKTDTENDDLKDRFRKELQSNGLQVG